MDPDIRTKKLKYPDPPLTDPTFYYPDPDSAPPNIRIFGLDPDRIRIWDKSFRPAFRTGGSFEREGDPCEFLYLFFL